MSLKKSKPITPGRRFASWVKDDQLTSQRPVKKLTKPHKKKGGRNTYGRITVRHQGGGHKKLLRKVDFKRIDKLDIPARVETLEYDPNRNANLALLVYADGERRYILAPEGLKVGQEVIASEKAELQPGNALPLRHIPSGMPIHNLELRPGKGGQIVRSAGANALILSKEGKWAVVKLPSGEKRKINQAGYATLGQVGRSEMKSVKIGKAGRKRHLGWRPSVRGVAMHPGAHPHGGGEGRSGIGMPSPKTPWGKKTLGKKTRKKKYSDKWIVERRK